MYESWSEFQRNFAGATFGPLVPQLPEPSRLAKYSDRLGCHPEVARLGERPRDPLSSHLAKQQIPRAKSEETESFLSGDCQSNRRMPMRSPHPRALILHPRDGWLLPSDALVSAVSNRCNVGDGKASGAGLSYCPPGTTRDTRSECLAKAMPSSAFPCHAVDNF